MKLREAAQAERRYLPRRCLQTKPSPSTVVVLAIGTSFTVGCYHTGQAKGSITPESDWGACRVIDYPVRPE
jgi:hypothetical protein